MQEIINEVKEGGVQLIDHTTSFLHGIAIDIQNIYLSKVNEVMPFDMAFDLSIMDLTIQCIKC
jgi:hypothetical protein